MSADRAAQGAPTARTSARRVAAWILLALVVGACVLFAARGWRKALRPQGSDFGIYHAAARSVLEGRLPDEVEGYLYPFAFAVLIAPLGLLPLSLAAALWQLASLAALLWSALGCARLATGRARPPPWLMGAALLCVLRLADSNLANGQVNAFTLAALVAALLALRNERELRAGAFLGLGSAVKVLPGVLLVPLALRRRWRTLGAGLAVLLLLGVGLPALVLGSRAVETEAQRWLLRDPDAHVLDAARHEEKGDYWPGQSLPAVARRLLTAAPGTSTGEEVSLVRLEPRTVAWISGALLLVHGALALTASLRRAHASGARAWLEEASLWVVLALVAAPMVHKAHLLWLLLPYSVLLAPDERALAPGARRARRVLLGLSITLIGLTTPALLGRAAATRALAVGLPFLGLEAVFAALALGTLAPSGGVPPGPRAPRPRR